MCLATQVAYAACSNGDQPATGLHLSPDFLEQQLSQIVLPPATFHAWVRHLTQLGYNNMPGAVPTHAWDSWCERDVLLQGSGHQLHVFGLLGFASSVAPAVTVPCKHVMLLNQLAWQLLLGDACVISDQAGSPLLGRLEAAAAVAAAEAAAASSAATGQHGANSADVAPLRASEWLVMAILGGGAGRRTIQAPAAVSQPA
jgi:hypothetical protein